MEPRAGGPPPSLRAGSGSEWGHPSPSPQDPHPPKSGGDKMLPGLRRLLQGKGPLSREREDAGCRERDGRAKPRPGPHPRAPRFAPRCLELVTVGARARLSGRAGLGFRGRCGAGLHLLRGTRRTLAGWGSADSASRVRARRPVPQHFAVTRDGGASRPRRDCEEEGAPTRELGSLWKVPEKGPGTGRRGGMTGVWRVEEGDRQK